MPRRVIFKTGEKAVLCSKCNRSFLEGSIGYKLHTKYKHPEIDHPEEKTIKFYFCKKCRHGFDNIESLKKHFKNGCNNNAAPQH